MTRKDRKPARGLRAALLIAVLTAAASSAAHTAGAGQAQALESKDAAAPAETDPAGALVSALVAACRANEAQFAKYLTASNSAAYLALPVEQRRGLLAQISLMEESGKPLISSDAQNRTVVRCQSANPSEFRLGDARVRENLAFIPVNAGEGHQIDFGLVREGGGWHLLSMGLVLLDVPQLAKAWVEQDFATREEVAMATLRALAEAIETYRRAFGKLPETLAQLGPAPPNEVSPDQADLVNEHMAQGIQNGYTFRYRILPAENDADSKFELAATPETYGTTGRRSFFRDAAGKTHGADKHGRIATFEDPLVEGEKAE